MRAHGGPDGSPATVRGVEYQGTYVQVALTQRRTGSELSPCCPTSGFDAAARQPVRSTWAPGRRHDLQPSADSAGTTSRNDQRT